MNSENAMNFPSNSSKRPRVRVAAIILDGDRILLAKHRRGTKNYWLLPGGGVEFGETLEEAIVRELKEEAALEIRVKDLVIINDSVPPNKHRHVINVYFTAEVLGGVLTAGCDARLVGMEYVPIERLDTLVFYPDVRPEVLRGIKEGFRAATYLGNLWKD